MFVSKKNTPNTTIFEYVWIGGVATLAQGARTSNLPGRAVRSTN